MLWNSKAANTASLFDGLFGNLGGISSEQIIRGFIFL